MARDDMPVPASALDEASIDEDELERFLGPPTGDDPPGGDDEEDAEEDADEKDGDDATDDDDDSEDEDEEAEGDDEEDEDEEDEEDDKTSNASSFSRARESAALTTETAELRELLTGLKEDIAELKAGKGEDTPDPAVLEAAGELKELQTELSNLVSAQRESLKRIEDLKTDAVRLEGEVRATPKAEREPKERKLELAVERYNKAVEKYRDGSKDLGKLERDIRKQQKAVDTVQAQSQERAQQARSQQKLAAEARKQEGQAFTDLVDKHFKALKLPSGDWKEFHRIVSSDVSATIRRLMAEGRTEPVQLADLVREAVITVAKLKGIRLKPSKVAADGKRKRASLKSLGREGAIRARRAAAPADAPAAGRKPDKLDRLSPAEQAAYWQRRARFVVNHGHAPKRRRTA